MKGLNFIAFIFLLSLSCTSPYAKLEYSETEIEKEFQNRLTEEEMRYVEIPFKVPDSIIADLKYKTSHMTQSAALDYIMNSISSANIYNLRYKDGATLTAGELIAQKEGNCISLSHLLVGISREFGITSHYVYILNNPTFSIYDHTISVNYHIMVGIDNGPDYRLYDFQPGYSKYFYRRNSVDDLMGIALHYNNLGAKSMQELDYRKAKIYLSIAHKLAPKNSEILSNYGLFFLRLDEYSKARTYFQKAIEIDESCYPAWHNLLYVTLKENDYEMFNVLKNQLKNVNSPTIKVFLANMAYREGDYEDALTYLSGINPEMTQLFIVYLLKAQAYYKLGKFSYAKKLLDKYQEIEPDDLHALILAMELDKVNSQ